MKAINEKEERDKKMTSIGQNYKKQETHYKNLILKLTQENLRFQYGEETQ
jgi:hypothetical protein